MMARRLWTVALAFGLTACAVGLSASHYTDSSRVQQLHQLLPADAIVLGEQHDAPDHQRVHRIVVEALSSQQALAALALEMASQGQSTAGLAPDASEEAVRTALKWNSDGWPWAAYGPAVMTAVRAGVPVIGANLPRAELRGAMADAALDLLVPAPALQLQQQNIRAGHCDMLPESQIAPMARIQIARDRAMAQTVAQASRPGKTVVLLAGGAHADRSLGVPLHMAASLKLKAVAMQADAAGDETARAANFDAIWLAQAAPPVDYCAKLAVTRGAAATGNTTPKQPGSDPARTP